MLKIIDFILLKAIFDASLYTAVMEKNETEIINILENKYTYELQNGFTELQPFNVDVLHESLIYQTANDNFDWAL